MKALKIRALCCAAAAALAACSGARLAPTAVPRRSADPGAAWAQTLSARVDARGRVDFSGLKNAPQTLEDFIGYLATFGPETDPALFPARESRLAYYLNAYNALAMYNAATSGVPPASQGKFFSRTKFMLGGSLLSLEALLDKVIRPLGDPRVHFAVNRMTRAGPKLPREPFSAAALGAQLDEAAREFLEDERNVRVDEAKRKVWLSSLLKWYKKDFLAKAPTLAAYVNSYRRRPIPESCSVAWLDYDWTLNSQ